MIEEVVQHSGDGSVRIIRQLYPSGYRSYVVEQIVDGTWARSKNGPWDYLANAREELRSLLRQRS